MQLRREQVIIQGHRGCRGRLPENSVAAFAYATQLGVDFIELDVVLTADHDVLVSHEPWMHHETTWHEDERKVSQSEASALSIFQMTTQKAQSFLLGLEAHPRFPGQQPVRSNKPTLEQSYKIICESSSPDNIPGVTIEVKSQPDWDGIYQPAIGTYAKTVYDEIRRIGIQTFTVQSFDPRILRELHKLDEHLPLILLNERTTFSPEEMVDLLGFRPFGYSPHFSLVDASTLETCSSLGLSLSVWTVNDTAGFDRMLELGVRNIITDFPDEMINRLLP